MEKRIIGILLTILGIAGILMAGYSFIHNASGGRNVREMLMYGIIGLIFFFSGIGLIRNTKDVVKNNERIS